MALNAEYRLQNIDRGRLRLAVIGVIGVLVVGAALFVLWARTPLGPAESAASALASDAQVTVTELDAGWLFSPAHERVATGVVLYPGGRVAPESYAPLARAIAAEGGAAVALASMPLNLAVFDPGRADALMDAAPGIQRWVVGGHSLGGAMAAAYAMSSDDARVKGVVLLAAYPADSTELAESGLHVMSLLGSEDDVVDRPTWDEGAERLPADTVYLVIEGGNHAQFGDYGEQPGDGVATISAADQQRQTVAAILELLGRI